MMISLKHLRRNGPRAVGLGPQPVPDSAANGSVKEDNLSFTSGSLLAHNSLINFGGRIAPLAVAIFAIPVMVRDLGTDRFGILTLVWMLIGYFSLFDFGLGRALTKSVAESLAKNENTELVSSVWTGISLIAALGIGGGVLVTLLSPWLVIDVMMIPLQLQSETVSTMYVLGTTLPIVIITTGFVAVLEAHQRFASVNLVRVVTGAYMYTSPLIILHFTQSLFAVVAVLALGRVIAAVAYLIVLLKVVPSLRLAFNVKRARVISMISFGSWITINNILDPFLVYLDRFLLASMVSMAAVAYYTTPFEVISKISLLPGAVAGVFFPAFSGSFGTNKERTARLFGHAIKSVFLVLFPITIVIVTLANEGLTIWLGGEFAAQSNEVLQWLAIGIFVNGLARIPDALIQGVGRPDLIVKVKLVEFPMYLILVWLMITNFGLRGAAISWVLRIILDTLFLFYFSTRILPDSRTESLRILKSLAIGGLCIGAAMTLASLVARIILLALTLIIFGLLSWNILMTAEDRVAFSTLGRVHASKNGNKQPTMT